MAQTNFKMVEVKGYTKDEAVKQVDFQIMRDATQAWKAAGKPVMEKDLRAFCADYLAKHTKFIANAGCVITIEAGSANTRETPCTVRNIKNEKGKRGFKTGYQAIDKATGEILFTNFETKAKAEKMAKELYKKGFTGDIFCRYVREVVSGEAGAFEVLYTPSKSAKVGKYICFGVEA